MASRQAAAARTPRPQLDQASIVDAAIELAAEGGEDAVTFRKLGARLGADPTAIYRHFRDKDELVQAAIDRLLAGVVEATRQPGTWRERLHRSAVVTVEVMGAHPGIGVEAGTRSTGGPAERDAIEQVLAALTEAGLSGDDLIRFYGVFTGYVLNFASTAAAGRLSRGAGAEPDDAYWIAPLSRVSVQQHPLIAQNATELAALTDSAVFEAGLKVILDAAEAAAGRSRS